MILQLPTLLAETHMAEVSLQYREDVATGGTSGIWYLLIPVVAIAIGVVIYKIVNRPPPIVNTPQGMLHELCRVASHRHGRTSPAGPDRRRSRIGASRDDATGCDSVRGGSRKSGCTDQVRSSPKRNTRHASPTALRLTPTVAVVATGAYVVGLPS